MASFTARRPPRAAWSVEECARFAALREYELLQLLSLADKKALEKVIPDACAAAKPTVLGRGILAYCWMKHSVIW